MHLLYIAAGINHFVNPEFYIVIMPKYIPEHAFMITLSGICEIAFGTLLIPDKTRPLAAWLIITMLTVFFTVHIQMVIDYQRDNNPHLWITILRLPLQFALIWWAWKFSRPSRNEKRLPV